MVRINTLNKKAKSYPSTVSNDSSLYEALMNNQWKNIRRLLKNKNVNDPVVTTGPFSGYTPLHIACMSTDHQLVELLLRTYKPDVNVVADDGTQPIHVVCLWQPPDYRFLYLRTRRLKAVLEANANADAEIKRETFLKFIKDKNWDPDFGDKMTLLSYAIVYELNDLAEELLEFNANPKITNLANKTLLMYALYNDLYDVVRTIVERINDPGLVNHRDNEGVSTIHYVLHPNKFGKSRYNTLDYDGFLCRWEKSFALDILIRTGADINALINNDPSTFIFNMAAYRSCPPILQSRACENLSMPLSRALYYATLPEDENSDKYFCVDPEDDREECLSLLRERRKECITVIIKDLVNRRIFGMPVPKEEIKLLDRLIVSDEDIRSIANSYQKDFIDGQLKTNFIELSDRKMTVFDFILQIFNNKKLKLLLKVNEDEQRVHEAWRKTWCNEDYAYFDEFIWKRMDYFSKRNKYLKQLDKISELTDVFPLPYEVILDIIEHLPNKELASLIDAFISS